jgi:flagellar protein FliS
MNKDVKQEFILRITQANKTGLVVILYDMTITYLEDALVSFDQGDKEDYRQNIQSAKGCLDELLASLHMEYELAGNLKSLYYFYKRELTSAAILEKKEQLQPIIAMLKELKASYEQVAAQDTSAPLMENTQTVYAGLTYGKSSLNVDLADQGTNRGFRI